MPLCMPCLILVYKLLVGIYWNLGYLEFELFELIWINFSYLN